MNTYNTVNIMMLFGFYAFLFGCAMAPPKLPPTENIQSIDDFESYLNSVVENGDPPGLSIAVVKGRDVVYQKGFGMADAPLNKAATSQTIYQ